MVRDGAFAPPHHEGFYAVRLAHKARLFEVRLRRNPSPRICNGGLSPALATIHRSNTNHRLGSEAGLSRAAAETFARACARPESAAPEPAASKPTASKPTASEPAASEAAASEAVTSSVRNSSRAPASALPGLP